MNVFIITENGIAQTPILVKNDVTAQATFDSIAENLVGDDIDEIGLHFDSQVDDLNRLISHTEIKVEWFVDVKVNKYKN